MVDRKKELKKWFIDHDMDCVVLANVYGCTKQAAHKYLFIAERAPSGFIDACLASGVPSDLLPPPTRSKAEILEENEQLHERLAFCWSALERCYIGPGELRDDQA